MSSYNIPLLLKLSEQIDENILIQAIKSVIQRHEILRTRIAESAEFGAYQEVVENFAEELKFHFLTAKIQKR